MAQNKVALTVKGIVIDKVTSQTQDCLFPFSNLRTGSAPLPSGYSRLLKNADMHSTIYWVVCVLREFVEFGIPEGIPKASAKTVTTLIETLHWKHRHSQRDYDPEVCKSWCLAITGHRVVDHSYLSPGQGSGSNSAQLASQGSKAEAGFCRDYPIITRGILCRISCKRQMNTRHLEARTRRGNSERSPKYSREERLPTIIQNAIWQARHRAAVDSYWGRSCPDRGITGIHDSPKGFRALPRCLPYLSTRRNAWGGVAKRRRPGVARFRMGVS